MKHILVFLFIIINCQYSTYALNKNETHPFKITLPGEWIEIPRDSITDPSIIKESPYENYDFIYKLKSSPEIFDFPLILIQINRVIGKRSVTHKDFAEREVSRIDPVYLKGIDDKLCYEHATGWIWQKSLLPDHTRLSIIIPGKTVSLNVYCFTSENSFENDIPTFFNIVKSVRVINIKPVYNTAYKNKLSKDLENNSPAIMIAMLFLLAGVPLLATGTLVIYKKQMELFWLLLKAFLLLIIVIFAPLLLQYVFRGTEPISIWIFYQLVMLILSVAFIHYISRGNYSEYGFNKISPNKIFKPVVYTILLGFIINLIQIIFLSIFGITSASPFELIIGRRYFWIPLLFAGIVEEVAVRGLIQSYLSPLKIYGLHLKSIFISIPVILSAALFGMIHLDFFGSGIYTVYTTNQALFAVILGLFLAYYREKYDSIIPGIISHITLNFILGILPPILFY